MRLSGPERIYSARKKAGHSQGEKEEIASAAAEHSESTGLRRTSVPESSLSLHLVVNLVSFLQVSLFSWQTCLQT